MSISGVSSSTDPYQAQNSALTSAGQAQVSTAAGQTSSVQAEIEKSTGGTHHHHHGGGSSSASQSDGTSSTTVGGVTTSTTSVAGITTSSASAAGTSTSSASSGLVADALSGLSNINTGDPNTIDVYA